MAAAPQAAGFEAVGGMRHVVAALREMVLLPLAYPELFAHLAVQPPRCARCF
jgi:ATP-dependent 26S proteasome regulatory subunit